MFDMFFNTTPVFLRQICTSVWQETCHAHVILTEFNSAICLQSVYPRFTGESAEKHPKRLIYEMHMLQIIWAVEGNKS